MSAELRSRHNNNTTCSLFCQVIFETSVCKVFEIKRARPCERGDFNPITPECNLAILSVYGKL